MSKIAHKAAATGAGVFTIEAPATATDRTLTLPDAGGQFHTSESVNDHAQMPTVGGDPIVESGSNSDGEWTRWADGTQVSRMNVDVLDTGPATFQYPASFVSALDLVFAHVINSGSTTTFTSKVSNVLGGSVDFGIVSGAGSWISAVDQRLAAIGRWK